MRKNLPKRYAGCALVASRSSTHPIFSLLIRFVFDIKNVNVASFRDPAVNNTRRPHRALYLPIPRIAQTKLLCYCYKEAGSALVASCSYTPPQFSLLIRFLFNIKMSMWPRSWYERCYRRPHRAPYQPFDHVLKKIVDRKCVTAVAVPAAPVAWLWPCMSTTVSRHSFK